MSSNASGARRRNRWAAFALLPMLAVGCGGGSDPVPPPAAAPANSTTTVTTGQTPESAPEPALATPVERPVEKVRDTRADAPADLPTEPPAAVAIRPVTWMTAAPRSDVARPTRILLPRLGIDAAVDPLYLNSRRVLVPPKYGRAGWYKAGPEPGEGGRAVVAGHVDSKTGPDVFAALHRARRGDRVLVRLADGSAVRFAVERVERHSQADFPTGRVYGGSTRHAALRLITCTGGYDRARGRYLDNLIVFATLIR